MDTEDIALLIFSLLGALIVSWPSVALRHNPHKSEPELVAISETFRGLNTRHFLGSMLMVATMLGAAFLVLFLGEAVTGKDSLWVYAVVVVIFGSMAAYEGIFALLTGVVPVIKQFRYIYGDPEQIRRVARRQIWIAVVFSGVAILGVGLLALIRP